MKKADLIKRLRRVATDHDVELTFDEGGNHTKVRVAGRPVLIPRHREINELTAQGILRDAERYAKGTNDE